MLSSIPRVVIIGAGFGGLQAVKELGKHPVQVTIIDALPHQNLTRGFTQLAAVGSAEVLLAEFGKGNGPWNTSTCPCPS